MLASYAGVKVSPLWKLELWEVREGRGVRVHACVFVCCVVVVGGCVLCGKSQCSVREWEECARRFLLPDWMRLLL